MNSVPLVCPRTKGDKSHTRRCEQSNGWFRNPDAGGARPSESAHLRRGESCVEKGDGVVDPRVGVVAGDVIFVEEDEVRSGIDITENGKAAVE